MPRLTVLDVLVAPLPLLAHACDCRPARTAPSPPLAAQRLQVGCHATAQLFRLARG